MRRLLMLALYRAGRQTAALEAYTEGRNLLVGELGLEPSPDLRDLHAAILRHDPELATAPPRTEGNLPAPVTSFVDREDDLTELHGLIRDEDVRLLTLTGVGGVGKTRLALELAAGLSENFPDGRYFVDLAPLEDAGARRIGDRGGARRP